MRFRALGHDGPRDPAQMTEVVFADTADIAERQADLLLETRLGPDALARKLLGIAREARTAEEEQGINILYLALGFLTWFEDKTSRVAREAPLVLLPVELVRNARTSTYDLRLRDEDLITNLPLQQRLADDFGIALPPLEVGDGWTPGAYFAQVEGVVADRTGWRVERDAMQLGFFSFAKLLMYRDLALDAWPDGALEAHGLTRGLLYDGFAAEPPLFAPDDRLDVVLPPDRLFHVVDADASQARVIEEVRAGRNLVVQGPPGTGKSQTITNIIAAAAREGKTVLFVAEKMAALSVVHDRLVKTGLRDICLELHSRTASKKVVLEEVARTLAAAQMVPAMPGAPVALTEVRDRLNAIAGQLHAPIGDTGETPFSVLGRQARYIGAGAPTPMLETEALATMSRATLDTLTEQVLALGTALDIAGPVDAHPFAGVGALHLQPVAVARLAGLLAEAAEQASALRAAIDAALTAFGLPLPRAFASAPAVADMLARLDDRPDGDPALIRALLTAADPARLAQGLDAARRWRALRDAEQATFADAAFDSDPAPWRAPIVGGTGSFFARWGSAYRAASRALASVLPNALPRTADDRLALVDRLLDVARLRRAWGEDEAFLAATLGAAWRGERTDFARIAAIADWAAQVRAGPLTLDPDRVIAVAADPARAAMATALDRTLPPARTSIDTAISTLMLDPGLFDGGIDGTDLTQIADRLATMARQTDRYAEWTRLRRIERRLDEAGLAALTDAMRARTFDGQAAVTELTFARAERLWRDAIAASPDLATFADLDRHALAARFAQLERAALADNVTAILATHLAQVPQGAQGEMAVVRGEIGKKRAHMAIRQLFRRAPAALQRIKPVLLMSPISVAQYLTPGALDFDLLVIDEASQVRPEDALGAVARANQIVVVGDQKQLPPSSFFDRLVADDDPDDAPDDGDTPDLLGGAAALGSLESILSLCEARGLSSRMLQWHYRSRDPSLIRVSNREFYRDALILPPSPLEHDPAYGLIFTRVDGVYDKGGKRDNRLEGDAIVARVAEHARAHPDLSLGIVTFSSAQRNTITELLDYARRTDTALDAFLREGQSEDVFVKNIENVQGDERDVILVSVGYGPTIPGGRLTSMTFGPVNSEGGERRLNVLFTRARLRCEVFASFDPGDIDIARVAREGPRILKRFLDYAQSGRIEEATVTGRAADSPFEEDVADVIRSLGYLADPQVGSAGFRIDLGIRHPDTPGTYVLAVECDGATYHSALWARERDRLRQDVLEHLGWRFHRIWSTDWFHDRAAEIARLQAALAEARTATAHGVTLDGANARRGGTTDAPPPAHLVVMPEAPVRVMPAYVRADFTVDTDAEPHMVAVAELAALARAIVEVEGPVHVEEIARRIAASFGRDKAGRRVLVATQEALAATDLQKDGDFWFTPAQGINPPVRDRSAETGATVKADALSDLEIRAALAIARADNAGGSDDDLIRTAARLMGFRRVRADLQARIGSGLAG
ncbi:DNA helicase [Sphingomonas sp. Leaf17]|nr:DNA helicase [Sphingomonas sp. Leaf17]